MEYTPDTGKRPLTSHVPSIPLTHSSRSGHQRPFMTAFILLVFLVDAAAALTLGWIAAEHDVGNALVARFSSQTAPSLVQHKRGVTRPPARVEVRSPFPTTTITPATSPTPTPASPVIVAEDTFERDAGRYWGKTSDGLAWKGDANRSDAFSLQGWSGVITGGDVSQTALLGRPLADSEVDAQVACSRFFGGTNVGVVLRWRDGAHWDKAYLDGKHLMVIKRVGVQTIVLGSVPFVARSGVFYSLRFRAVRGQLLAAASSLGEGSSPWQIVVSDPAPPSLGEEGLRVYFHGRGEVTARFTSYLVYALR